MELTESEKKKEYLREYEKAVRQMERRPHWKRNLAIHMRSIQWRRSRT